MDTRVRTLTPEDLNNMEAMYEKFYPTGGSYWLDIERALNEDDPPIQLHRCTCGITSLLTKEALANILRKHKELKSTLCWHKFSLENTLGGLNWQVNTIVSKISHLLMTNEIEARALGYGLLPIDTAANFDYSLWKLQLILLSQDYFKSSKKDKKTDFKVSYFKELAKLYNKAKKVNPAQYEELINYFIDPKYQKLLWESLEIALNKLIDSQNILSEDAYNRVTKKFSPIKRISNNNQDKTKKQSLQYKIDAYQAYFEIKEVIYFLFNLVQISKGEDFKENPFENLRTSSGENINDNKGLMIRKICEVLGQNSLSTKIKLAYDNKFRNQTAGHNDYIVDLKKQLIINKTLGTEYSFVNFEDKFWRIKSFFDTILITSNLAHYEFNEVELSRAGGFFCFYSP